MWGTPGATMSRFHLIAISFSLSACGAFGHGTQIGFEDSFVCEVISSETVADLDTIAAGFDRSPRDVIDGLTGSFSGPQLDELEEPTADLAWLTVADTGGPVIAEQYQAVSGQDGGDDLSHLCAPVYFFDLDVVLTADGLPTFASTLSAASSEGSSRAGSYDEAAFDDALPDPVTFDPTQFDLVQPRAVLSGGDGVWWAYVSWEASNPDEAEPDGDLTIHSESLMMAALESARRR